LIVDEQSGGAAHGKSNDFGGLCGKDNICKQGSPSVENMFVVGVSCKKG